MQVLIDAVVHAVNKDYEGMAGDFVNLGFLSKGTDVTPIVPALEKIWAAALGQSLADFNFRTVTSKFNELVFNYPIRIPERYSLVIRSLLTQEGICLTLDPSFHFLEVAYPYIAKRLLTDESLRERLIQVRAGELARMCAHTSAVRFVQVHTSTVSRRAGALPGRQIPVGKVRESYQAGERRRRRKRPGPIRDGQGRSSCLADGHVAAVPVGGGAHRRQQAACRGGFAFAGVGGRRRRLANHRREHCT